MMRNLLPLSRGVPQPPAALTSSLHFPPRVSVAWRPRSMGTPTNAMQHNSEVNVTVEGSHHMIPAASPAEALAQAKDLEQQAAARHLEAQSLNKEGRYAEAQEKYAEMRALDAEALRLSQSLGCAGCGLPESNSSSSNPYPTDGSQQSSPPLYTELHIPRPWPGPAVEARAKAAVLASAVADAAATGVQWIYDLNILQQLLEERQQGTSPGAPPVGLEFMDPPRSPFLPQYAVGRASPYGEETWTLLSSLAAQGGLCCVRYAALYAQLLGEGFDGYRNASTTGFLRNYGRQLPLPETGADDKQADCVARLAPLVAMYAGDIRLMQMVVAATRTTQNTDEAVAWAAAGAAVLERLLLGSSALAAMQDTISELQGAGVVAGRMPVSHLGPQLAAHLQQALDLRQQPVAEVISSLGRNCHMPNACQTPLHIVLHHEWRLQQQQQQQQQQQGSDPSSSHGPQQHERDQGPHLTAAQAQEVYVAGIRDALAGGGCCASRAGFAGALLGALLGPECVPESWSQRTSAWAAVEAAVDQLSAARGAQ